MSGSDRPDKGSTAPMNAHGRAATQVSASAVPSTLESPNDPPRADGAPFSAGAAPARAADVEEISAALIVHGPASHAPAPSVPPGPHSGVVSDAAGHRLGAPSTMMSPAVNPQAFREAPHDPRPEEAVTIAPAFPIVDRAAQAQGGRSFTQRPPSYDASYGGAPYGGQGPGGRRGMSTTMLALIVVGAVVAVLAVGVVVVGFFLYYRGAHATSFPLGGSPTVAPQPRPVPAPHTLAPAPTTTAPGAVTVAPPGPPPPPTPPTPPLAPPTEPRGGHKAR